MGARVPSGRPTKYLAVPCGECGYLYRRLNGAWLRDRRQRAGIDQRTLARRLGVSGSYLSDIERNRRACPERVLAAYRRLKGKGKS